LNQQSSRPLPTMDRVYACPKWTTPERWFGQAQPMQPPTPKMLRDPSLLREPVTAMLRKTSQDVSASIVDNVLAVLSCIACVDATYPSGPRAGKASACAELLKRGPKMFARTAPVLTNVQLHAQDIQLLSEHGSVTEALCAHALLWILSDEIDALSEAVALDCIANVFCAKALSALTTEGTFAHLQLSSFLVPIIKNNCYVIWYTFLQSTEITIREFPNENFRAFRLTTTIPALYVLLEQNQLKHCHQNLLHFFENVLSESLDAAPVSIDGLVLLALADTTSTIFEKLVLPFIAAESNRGDRSCSRVELGIVRILTSTSSALTPRRLEFANIMFAHWDKIRFPADRVATILENCPYITNTGLNELLKFHLEHHPFSAETFGLFVFTIINSTGHELHHIGKGALATILARCSDPKQVLSNAASRFSVPYKDLWKHIVTNFPVLHRFELIQDLAALREPLWDYTSGLNNIISVATQGTAKLEQVRNLFRYSPPLKQALKDSFASLIPTNATPSQQELVCALMFDIFGTDTFRSMSSCDATIAQLLNNKLSNAKQRLAGTLETVHIMQCIGVPGDVTANNILRLLHEDYLIDGFGNDFSACESREKRVQTSLGLLTRATNGNKSLKRKRSRYA